MCPAARHALEESAEVLDCLGQAPYWQGTYTEALSLRERACALYGEQDDRRSAAEVAIALAQLHGLIYGNPAAVKGWVGHARRMLEECADCTASDLLELFVGCIAPDPVYRERRARAAGDSCSTIRATIPVALRSATGVSGRRAALLADSMPL